MAAGKRKSTNVIIFVLLSILTVIFMVPMALVLINSFKSRLYISVDPFAFPNEETFVGLKKLYYWPYFFGIFVGISKVFIHNSCFCYINSCMYCDDFMVYRKSKE